LVTLAGFVAGGAEQWGMGGRRMRRREPPSTGGAASGIGRASGHRAAVTAPGITVRPHPVGAVTPEAFVGSVASGGAVRPEALVGSVGYDRRARRAAEMRTARWHRRRPLQIQWEGS